MVLHVGMGIENPRLTGRLGCFGRKCFLFMRVYRHPLRSGISFVHACIQSGHSRFLGNRTTNGLAGIQAPHLTKPSPTKLHCG